MSKALSEKNREWYYSALEQGSSDAVSINRNGCVVTYHSDIRSDKSRVRTAEGEEFVHAVLISMLASDEYKYKKVNLGHEMRFAHGSRGSNADVVDVIIWDEDGLPFAIIELKSAEEYDREKAAAIRYQLFGTAPLVGAPKLLIYATVVPDSRDRAKCKLRISAICIDYSKYRTYETWQSDGEPCFNEIPIDYRSLSFKPFKNDNENDLDLNSTPADLRAIARTFHNEFFGEHPDNTLFGNLVKCLLAKICDERTCQIGQEYDFQILNKNDKPEKASDVFARVNQLYKYAYRRYVDPDATDLDEINPNEFSEESVKSVVQTLQGISITKGATRHGDVIGAFFEEILRAGFKQDRGMYFTHDNLVRFMVEALDIRELTRDIWKISNHPNNRLPYVIDPACGSGTFLLHGMSCITDTVKNNSDEFATDHESKQFYNARLSDDQPNYWAENFIYGLDPKFLMAVTSKVNMVLHGDGSTHVFKEDAFKPLASYGDPRLRPCNEANRSINSAAYPPDLCEQFDVIVSNPPFSIKLSAETRAYLHTTFTLPDSTPSEGLFVERCFQLLKSGGRLGIVLPESLLNAKEMIDVRLLLYRFFIIRAIVSMPRNLFIDTPTLTSLVFAEKKSKTEISEWDNAWAAQSEAADSAIKQARNTLTIKEIEGRFAAEVANNFLASLKGIVNGPEWISKGGKSPALMTFTRDWGKAGGQEAAEYYRAILNTAGFRKLCQGFIFRKVASALSYDFPAYEVDEVGYKLSKRGEKARVNQLCSFVGRQTTADIANLHHSDEEYVVKVNTDDPKTVLDYIRRDVRWGNGA